jgi:hypothetical protein
MNASNRIVNNCAATSHEFSVKFRGIDELFCVELKDNLRSLSSRKEKIEVMYHLKEKIPELNKLTKDYINHT